MIPPFLFGAACRPPPPLGRLPGSAPSPGSQTTARRVPLETRLLPSVVDLELEIVHQPHALHGERAEAVGRCTSCRAGTSDERTRIDRCLDLHLVGADANVRETEIERVRAGGLQDQINRGREVTRASDAAHHSHTRADLLRQRLDAGIQGDAVLAAERLATEDSGDATVYRFSDLNLARREIRDDRPQVHAPGPRARG